jgi:hypothetical protein
VNQQLSIDFAPRVRAARKIGEERANRCRNKADEVCPGFGERALNFIADYAKQHDRFSGEHCTFAMKAAGIKAHDDRATGSVYAKAIRMGLIHVVGYVPRVRGNGTAGGRLYARGPMEGCYFAEQGDLAREQAS